MRRIVPAIVFTLFSATFLRTTAHAGIVTGADAPDQYQPLTTTAKALSDSNNQYGSGNASFADYSAIIAGLSHGVKVAPDADGSPSVTSSFTLPKGQSSEALAAAAASAGTIIPTISDPLNLLTSAEKSNILAFLMLLPPADWAGVTSIAVSSTTSTNINNEYGATNNTLIINVTPTSTPGLITASIAQAVGFYYYDFNAAPQTRGVFENTFHLPSGTLATAQAFANDFASYSDSALPKSGVDTIVSEAKTINNASVISEYLFLTALFINPGSPEPLGSAGSVYTYQISAQGVPSRSTEAAYIIEAPPAGSSTGGTRTAFDTGPAVRLGTYNFTLDSKNNIIGIKTTRSGAAGFTFGTPAPLPSNVLDNFTQVPSILPRPIRPTPWPRE